jgi:hypothetical protein
VSWRKAEKIEPRNEATTEIKNKLLSGKCRKDRFKTVSIKRSKPNK